MKDKKATKSSNTPTLTTALSLLLFLSTIVKSNANIKNSKQLKSKNSTTILNKINEFCKQKSSKKNKTLKSKETCRFQQEESDDFAACSSKKNQTKNAFSSHISLSQLIRNPIEYTDYEQINEILLDAYEIIKDFYAYDPIAQIWVQIKSFKIVNGFSDKILRDQALQDSVYTTFLAYDLPNQRWHKVNLIPYLQQANTQINSHFPATATNKSTLPNHNYKLNNIAKDELLEELLGVHTFITPCKQNRSIWKNFSFDFNIGSGATFYSNRLEQMFLLQSEQGSYFFITKSNKVYKPNWFHYTLDEVIDFDPLNGVTNGRSKNATFQGKGLALPITLGIQYLFPNKIFIGIGREIVFNRTNKLVHNETAIKHKDYIIDNKWSAQGRWFAKLGTYAFGNQKHRFFGDMRLFYVHHFGVMFRRLITLGDYLYQGLAYNFGLGYEQQLIDSLSWTMRLSMEFQRFKQFSNEKASYNIEYKQPAIYLQMGLSIRPTQDTASKYLKNKEYQNKNNKLNGVIKLEELEDLLDLD